MTVSRTSTGATGATSSTRQFRRQSRAKMALSNEDVERLYREHAREVLAFMSQDRWLVPL